FFAERGGVGGMGADGAAEVASVNGASGRTGGTCSGGMVQRLGLAVALLPSAPILLLDEPTAALDPDGLCAFYGIVERRKRAGQTIFFTSHQLGDAERLADRFAVIVDGRLAALLSARDMADRLSARGVLRLRLSGPSEELPERVRSLVPAALTSGDQLIVPGPAAIRPAVIDAVRSAGGEILGLTAEDGRLDVFYRELVSERT